MLNQWCPGNHPSRAARCAVLSLLVSATAGCGKADPEPPAEARSDGQASEAALVEVDLGTHRLREYDPVTDTTLQLDFQLGGTLHSEDEPEFVQRMQSQGNKIRDRVMVAARICEASDFLDPQLVLFRRHLRKRIHQAIGKPLLRDVLLTSFSQKVR